jgi:hypothetical protein
MTDKMKRIVIVIISVLILIISGLYILIDKSDFWKIDKCLDSGGSWNYDSKECIKCKSDFLQLKKAENYSICSKYEIENRSEKLIDSFQIVPHGYISDNFIKIAPKQTRKFITDMSTIKKCDGHYQLSYNNESGQKEFMEFGYYTNGYPLEKITRIVIEQDSIFMNSEFDKY